MLSGHTYAILPATSHARSRASRGPYGTNIARGSSLPTKASMAKVTRK